VSLRTANLALLLALALPPPARPQALRVHVASGGVRVDGRLDEPDWARADSLADFRQREPVVGAPASERTVVKALRDGDALYIGVLAYDAEPGRIRATQLRRDADLSSDDNIQLLIDSFHDRRTAFVSGTNPHRARSDAQLTALHNLHEHWTGTWDVPVPRDAAGWTAELPIPFQ